MTEQLTPIRRTNPHRHLRVSESFGPTLQGEGPSAGRRAWFLRLSGCNLNCSWCDTPYTWDWEGQNGVAYDRREEADRVPVERMVDRLAVHVADTGRLVITGGEPMLQQTALLQLVQHLPTVQIEIETNGTIAPNPEWHLYRERLQFNVSPKLVTSGCDQRRAIKYDVLGQYREAGAVFKFVVTHRLDGDQIRALTTACRIPRPQVWLMPEGTTPRAVANGMRDVWELAIANGWQVTTRLHTLAYGDQRGH